MLRNSSYSCLIFDPRSTATWIDEDVAPRIWNDVELCVSCNSHYFRNLLMCKARASYLAETNYEHFVSLCLSFKGERIDSAWKCQSAVCRKTEHSARTWWCASIGTSVLFLSSFSSLFLCVCFSSFLLSSLFLCRSLLFQSLVCHLVNLYRHDGRVTTPDS